MEQKKMIEIKLTSAEITRVVGMTRRTLKWIEKNAERKNIKMTTLEGWREMLAYLESVGGLK